MRQSPTLPPKTILNEPTELSTGKSGSFSPADHSVKDQQYKEQTSLCAVSRVVMNDTTTQAPTKTLPAHLSGTALLLSLIAKWFDANPGHAVRITNENAYLTKRWRDLSKVEKCQRGFQYAAETDGIALSLNFSDLIQARAREHEDPAGYLSDRVTTKLRKHGLAGLPFAFVLEFSMTGKLHAHGVIVPMGQQLQIIEKAFSEAGGRVAGKSAARQLKTSELFGGQGFYRYARKARKNTTVVLEGRRFAIMNRSLNEAAQDFHENNRPK